VTGPPEPPLAEVVARLERVAADLARLPRADDVLDVAAVAARYSFADDRAARSVMRQAGSFRVGGRLFVRRVDLERLEAARVERPAPAAPTRAPRQARRRPAPAKLEPGFWRET
jgi:hypothetical protein